MATLQDRTDVGGVHVILPGDPSLAPEALLPFYPDWTRERRAAGRKAAKPSPGIVLTKPCPTDTGEAVSLGNKRKSSRG
jgi:hypothetical protein